MDEKMKVVSFKSDDGHVWTEHRHIMQSKGIATWERDDEQQAVTLYRSGRLHYESIFTIPLDLARFITERAELLWRQFQDGTLKWKESVPSE